MSGDQIHDDLDANSLQMIFRVMELDDPESKGR